MKTSLEIVEDLAKNGYNWMPNYKNILEKVWSNMETYFNENEEVLSALWASFKRYDDDMLGVVFITTKRTFTLEVLDNDSNTQIRYLPFDSYRLEKIQLQLAKTPKRLNYVSLQSDSFGNGITFATPNKDVAKHFIDTLRGSTNGVIEILPESDDPLLANNEKEQVIDEDLEKAKEIVPHKHEKKHEELKPIEENPNWRKAPPLNSQKEVEIKIVPPKKEKKPKIRKEGYASKWKSKLWLCWFLLPVGLISIIITMMILI